MKKLLSILFLACSLNCFSQFPSNPTQGNPNTKNIVMGAWEARKGMVVGVYSDTSSANSDTYTKGVPYITITTTSGGNVLWQRNSTATQWVQMSGGGNASVCQGVPPIVSWNTGLSFFISSGTYCINNTLYTHAGSTITLDAADPVLPRIDLIGVNTSGNSFKITGTPSATPAAPSFDPNTQYYLTTVLILGGATTPSGVVSTVLYDENIGSPEYTGVASGVSATFGSTADPFHLTVSTSAGAFTDGNTITYTGQEYSIDSYNSIRFFIKLKAALTGGASISLQLMNDGLPRTVVYPLNINNGNTTAYQNITIPLSALDPLSDIAGNPMDGVRFIFNGTNASGVYIDYITLNSGTAIDNSQFVTDVYARNDSLFKVKNGISTFWYKVPANLQEITEGGNTTNLPIILTGTDPNLTLKQDFTNKEYRFRVGIGSGIANSAWNLFSASDNKIIMGTDGGKGLRIGNYTTGWYASSMLQVRGGASGANIDAQPDSTVNDEGNIEIMASDFSEGKGIAMRGWGNVGVAGSTVLGYSKRNLGLLDFNNDFNIIRTIHDRSLRFGTNDIERMILDSTGNFTIGSASAGSEKLNVIGSVKIVDGTEGVGKVLTSDANGKGSWTTPAAGGTTIDETIVATGGQTAFTFTTVPADYANYLIFINGAEIENTTYFTTSGNIVTFTSGLVAGDRVRYRRIK